MNIANDIMAEAQQLAAKLRVNGKKMSQHLKEFARLAEKVSTAMRNTRAEVLHGETPMPPAAVLPRNTRRRDNPMTQERASASCRKQDLGASVS
jgi:hypothetical protein